MQAARGITGRTLGLVTASTIGGILLVLALLFGLYGALDGKSAPSMRGLYVIYYGPLVKTDGKISDQAQRILDAKPRLALVVYSSQDDKDNATSTVIKQFREAGIKVLTYTWTKYGVRSLEDVKKDIYSQLNAGADGIFVDEVTNVTGTRDFAYYSSIYHTVKDYNQTRIVVMNPGRFNVSQSIMGISDILSLEQDWIFAGKIPWKAQYAPERFMGVSSNEYCNPACVSQSNAENLTRAAWNMGIGYHFATDKYIELPRWYDTYTSDLQQVAAVPKGLQK